MKPYTIGGTITDNVLKHEVGALNTAECSLNGSSPTNLLDFSFKRGEKRIHEAQKPIDLIDYLIRLTTLEGQIVLDPFMGAGTTAVASRLSNRRFIGFELNAEYHEASIARLESIDEVAPHCGSKFQQESLL
jgi:site-specific DNA-methyltransferase (adenine-specific)